ncbi:nucleoside-diphosphate-sugar epimerase [Nocardioides albertanoniae]|uniref:Nucleoside-diphosphate-sugar epimerase n=1 Tax=Nocardioides albertanoniae TaxID=1175486 RepID=A0A543A2R2_9ACTN|nr:SDR family oxidoreductase [Nocardioides albertanoniae]TQL66746.1 nucleoside-diphosphate-sugar epimerase [Nocardioides albertanoniae]
MNIFITGASGWIGSAVTDELLANGYAVTGLARSDKSAAALEAKGVDVHRGSLDDPASLAAAAKAADAVIHLAFIHDFDNFAASGRAEHDAVKAMLDALEGSGKTFMLASGTTGASRTAPGAATEDDPSPFHGRDSVRGGAENLALSYAEKDVRPVALRFPIVHGRVGDPGFVAYLAQVAKERGVSGYIGDGSQVWAAVDRADAALGVRLALEKAPAGFRAHIVAEQGTPTREIAEALGQRLGLPVESVSPEDAEAHFGWMARMFGAGTPASSDITRRTLGWTPTGPTLLDDIAAGAYDL